MVPGRTEAPAQSTRETSRLSTEIWERAFRAAILGTEAPKRGRLAEGWPVSAREPTTLHTAPKATSEATLASPAVKEVTITLSEQKGCAVCRVPVLVERQAPTEALRFWCRVSAYPVVADGHPYALVFATTVTSCYPALAASFGQEGLGVLVVPCAKTGSGGHRRSRA